MKNQWEKDGRKGSSKIASRGVFGFMTIFGPIAFIYRVVLRSDFEYVGILACLAIYYYITFTTTFPIWYWKALRWANDSWLARRVIGKNYDAMWAEFAEEWKERFGEEI